jgi:hypothetical protein
MSLAMPAAGGLLQVFQTLHPKKLEKRSLSLGGTINLDSEDWHGVAADISPPRGSNGLA